MSLVVVSVLLAVQVRILTSSSNPQFGLKPSATQACSASSIVSAGTWPSESVLPVRMLMQTGRPLALNTFPSLLDCLQGLTK
jgi:hypothetical protein